MEGLGRWSALVGLLVAWGCGYTVRSLEGGVALCPLENRTARAGVDLIVTQALREELLARGFRLCPPRRARYVLRGAVRDLERSAISFSRADYARQYRIRARVELWITDPSGRLLCHPCLEGSGEYLVVSDLAVTEEHEEEALRALARQVARQLCLELRSLRP